MQDTLYHSLLSKLLATENINVIVGKFQTASFDPVNRDLRIPQFTFDNKDALNLMIAHEVGHALYTPTTAIPDFESRFPNIPFAICNILEDMRIEQMIINRYPGLTKTFRNGYTFLSKEGGIFEVPKNVQELNFMDRINLKGKLRDLVDIDFTKAELEFFKKTFQTKTFEDVLDLCQEFIDLYGSKAPTTLPSPDKFDQPEEESEDAPNVTMQSDESEKSDESEQSEKSDENEDESESEETTSTRSLPELPEDDHSFEDEDPFHSKLQDQWDENLKSEIDKSREGLNWGYDVRIPTDKQLIEHLVTYETLEKYRYTGRFNRKDTSYAPKQSWYTYLHEDEVANQHWAEYKKHLQREIRPLINTFNRRKQATAYAHATVAPRGTIDVNKLHSFKYNDDIFQRVMNMQDGKNHGISIMIDTSASMTNILGNVQEQALELALFCDAVGIPYQICTFTGWCCEYTKNCSYIDDDKPWSEMRPVDLRDTTVVEVMSSRLPRKVKERAMMDFYFAYGSSCHIHTPSVSVQRYTVLHKVNEKACLTKSYQNKALDNCGGTPTSEALLIFMANANAFRKANNVEIMNTVIMTDGEPCAMDNIVPKYSKADVLSTRSSRSRYRLVDSNGKFVTKYNLNAYHPSGKHANILLVEDLLAYTKKKYGMKQIGIFVGASTRQFRWYEKSARTGLPFPTPKNTVTHAKNASGYDDNYFILIPTSNSDSNDDSETFDPTKARERTKLAKSLIASTNSKNSKKAFFQLLGQTLAEQ